MQVYEGALQLFTGLTYIFKGDIVGLKFEFVKGGIFSSVSTVPPLVSG